KTSNSTLQIPLRRSFSSKRSGIRSVWRTKFEIKSKPFVSKKVFAKSTSSERWPSGRLWLQIIQTFRQIIEGTKAGRLVFVEPTFGNLLQRSRTEIMQLFAPAPKGNNEIGFD